jgi:hypothetical protein
MTASRLKKYSDTIKARNAEAERLRQEKAPCVGVFWIHPITMELVSSYATPLSLDLMLEAHADGIQSALWNTVKDHYADLKHLKHDEIPRGRIYRESNTFHVCGPKPYLDDLNVKKQILETYNLPEPRTMFHSFLNSRPMSA